MRSGKQPLMQRSLPRLKIPLLLVDMLMKGTSGDTTKEQTQSLKKKRTHMVKCFDETDYQDRCHMMYNAFESRKQERRKKYGKSNLSNLIHTW